MLEATARHAHHLRHQLPGLHWRQRLATVLKGQTTDLGTGVIKSWYLYPALQQPASLACIQQPQMLVQQEKQPMRLAQAAPLLVQGHSVLQWAAPPPSLVLPALQQESGPGASTA
jgi:hypothetical protein